jgi:hypothetical protein
MAFTDVINVWAAAFGWGFWWKQLRGVYKSYIVSNIELGI